MYTSNTSYTYNFDIAFIIIFAERQKSDAVRTEAIFLDVNGRAFWKLKGYTGGQDILLQGLFCFLIV